MTQRKINLMNNQEFIKQNREDIARNAPSGAVHYVVRDQKVIGYFSNWIEAFDAMGTIPGSMMGDL